MLYVLIRIASSRRFYWVHSTYHFCIEDLKYFRKLSPLAPWPGAMINPQRFELPMSRTNLHGPKDVRAVEVWLYIPICSAVFNDSEGEGQTPCSLTRAFAVYICLGWFISHGVPHLLKLFKTVVYKHISRGPHLHVRTVKTQISLRVRAVWSESSQGTLRVTKDP